MAPNHNYFGELPKVVKGTGINLFGAISGHILSYAYVFLLAKFLNTNDLGLYYLGITIVTFTTVLSRAGMETGIHRFVSIYHGCNDVNGMRGILAAALILVVPLSIILGLALFLCSGTIANTIFSKPALSNVLKLFSLYLPFFVLTSVCLSATQAMKYMQYRVYSMDIANTVLKIAFISIFFYFGLRLFGAVFATILSIILVTGLSLYFLKRVFPPSKQENNGSLEFKKLLLFCIPQSFSNIIYHVLNMTGTLMLGYFALAASVGVYNVALKIALLGACILWSFNTIFGPMIADLHHQGKHNQLEGLYKTITKWVITLSFPLFLFLISFSNPILKIFGSDFVAGRACLVILCIGRIIIAATGPSGLIVLMSGHPYVSLFNNILTFALNVTLNLLLIPKYGIMGAAIATSSSMAFLKILELMEVYYFMRIHPYDLSYLKSVFASVGCILIVTLGSNRMISIDGFWSLAMVSTTFLLIYSLCLILLRLDDADHFVLSKIKQQFVIDR